MALSDVEQVSKLDAARRQLDCAITLYFNDGDSVSTHTLVAAAYEVLQDLSARENGMRPMLKERVLDFVRPECRKTVQRKLSEAANFFKHANRDPAEVLEFSASQTESLLLDACDQHTHLTRTTTPAMQAMRLWYIVHHLDVCILPEDEMAKLNLSAKVLTRMKENEFFALAEESFTRALAANSPGYPKRARQSAHRNAHHALPAQPSST